jgi:hypothetical protein
MGFYIVIGLLAVIVGLALYADWEQYGKTRKEKKNVKDK